MEKKELKKLGLNKKATDLTNLEASQIRGGGYWDPEFGWCADEVTVYGGNNSSGARKTVKYLFDHYGGLRTDGWKDGSNSAQIGWFFGRWIAGW